MRKNRDKTRQTKSPLKDGPLRTPGQGLDEEVDRLLNDKVTMYLTGMGMIGLLALMEWQKAVFDVPPRPIAFTAAAVLAWGFCIRKLIAIRRELRNLVLARRGERVVGQFLEEHARPLGYHVFHDVVGAGFNVDHVLVGAGGLYAIETKTASKPAKGMSSVRYDGHKVMVDGFVPDRDPVAQAKACAAWVRDVIKDSTGRQVQVRPVVIYPGWYVEKMPRGAEVWVLNEKAFAAFLRNEKQCLSDADASMIAHHLKMHVAAREKVRQG